MRILIPQICVASGLLEIFQKMQLRGRRNGHKHRVVGSSHRKAKRKKLLQQATQAAAAAAAGQQQRRRHARPRIRCNDESQRPN